MRSRIGQISIFLMVFMMLYTSIGFAYETTTSDVIGLFKDVMVSQDTRVDGSVVAIFGNINIHGQVSEDVVAVFGNIIIDGEVQGDSVAVFGGMNLTEKGRIQGDAVQVLGGSMVEAPGAYVGGEKVSVASVGFLGGSWLSGLLLLIFLFTLGKIIMSYVLSVIAVLVFPQQFASMAEEVPLDLGKKFLIGGLVILGFYVLATLLVMVVIGIPFLILLAPCMALLGFTGNTAVKLAIGRKISRAVEKNWSQMMELFIGTLVYGVIEITVIGKVAIWVGKAVGIGAVVESKAGTKRPPIGNKVLD